MFDIVHAMINVSYIWDFCEVLTLTKKMHLHGGSSEEEKRYCWFFKIAFEN